MSLALIVVLGLIPVLAGGVAGYRAASGLPDLQGRTLIARNQHLAIVALLPLVLMAANVWLETRTDWQWRLPFWAQANADSLCRLAIFGCVDYVFGFVVGLAWRRKHPRKWWLLCLAVGLVVGLPALAQPKQVVPLTLGAPRFSASGDVLQSTPYTCVPAVAANILAHLGVRETEVALAQRMGATKEGTSVGRAAMEFERLGFHVTKRTVNNPSLDALTPPAMLLVDGDSHVVAFFGVTNETARIVDPSSGSRLVSRKRLAERWTGRALEIRRKPE